MIASLFEMTIKCKKIRYKNRKEAKSVLKYREDVFGKPYPCKIKGCKSWHLGHKTAKKSPEGIRRRNRSRSIRHFNELLDLIDVIFGANTE